MIRHNVTFLLLFLWLMSWQVVCGQTLSQQYPFLIISDRKEEVPAMSDSLFNAIATGIEFKVNKTKVDEQCEFFRMYYQELLPILRREQLYPIKIYIRGAASPEGPYANNQRLGMGRTQYLLKILSESLQVEGYSANLIEGKVITEDYGYLADMMDAAGDPDAATVRQALESCGWDELSCKQTLQQMQGGKLWKRLNDTYFPRLRTARLVICLAHRPNTKTADLAFNPIVPVIAPRGRRDTIYLYDTIYVKRTTTVIEDSLAQLYGGYPYGNTVYYWGKRNGQPMAFTPADSIRRHLLFALKTNLFFDVLTALNGSIEYPLGNHYSISAEVVWPWWVDKRNQWCFQMGNVGLEGRYYFRPWQRHSSYRDWYLNRNAPLLGTFVGLHADATYYDFEWKGHGHQGEAWSAGITVGYQRRLARQWNLECSLGIGGAKHQYRKYDVSEDDKHLWRRDRIKNQWYFGPTKARISLVYLLTHKCGKKCQKGDEQ